MLTFDNLAVMTDEELNNTLVSLENERNRSLKKGYPTKEIECDICYVSREIDIRNTRHRAHEKWLRDLGATTSTGDSSVN